MSLFYQREPSSENSWRGIILFGENTATYKFALGRSLIDLANEGKEFVTLEQLAVPFSEHTCNHLKLCDKQITQRSSRFLEACRKFNRNEMGSDELVSTTAQEGFRYVLDRFHVLDGESIDQRFYEREGEGAQRGIRIRQELTNLVVGPHGASLSAEVEARWRLVETAWSLSVPSTSLEVSYDQEMEELFIRRSGRRQSITACRDALSGYQQGMCFYCRGRISVLLNSPELADVDHFIPHRLRSEMLPRNINGVWNLVLACRRCNRGRNGKHGKLAPIKFLENLHDRNEHYIKSHHPLRETIRHQTAKSVSARTRFLNSVWHDAQGKAGSWVPE